MADRYTHTRCGHQSTGGAYGSGDYSIDDLCLECRNARIGQTIQFIRFGSPTESSQNHRDGVAEPGMSCYAISNGKADLVGWHFGFLDRVAWIGSGIICGWGSDGEPLVRDFRCRKISNAKKAGYL